MNRVLLPALAGLLLLSPPPCEAAGCSCIGPRTVAEARDEAAAVFAGTVSGVRRERRGTAVGRVHGRVYTFRVQQAWKGAHVRTVEVRTGMGGGDCGIRFRRGETYLVYAYRTSEAAPRNAPPRFSTGICSRTRQARAAREDLHLLGTPERTWPRGTR